MPNKTYQYRLYLTRKQETTLTRWLALCCETYNAALDERKSAYHMAGVSLSYEDQCAELPGCKAVRPDLAEVPSQVLQDVVKRVDLAFDGFYRRLAEGQKPGYPRFKSRFRYASMTFKQYGHSFSVEASQIKNRGKLILAKLGHVKMVMHRPLQGIPKTAIVKRTPTGKWFVSICCEDVPVDAAPSSDKEVGIDIGLKIFAYLSDGTTIENPRFFRQAEKNLAKAQRKRDQAPKKSKARTKLNTRVTRVYERTKNRRKHFAHQPASQGRERVPVHRCRGPGRAQYGEKSEIGEKYGRCGLVAVLRIPSKQSGRGWQGSDASEPGLHVANLFLLWASPRDAALGQNV